jgi:hypothetical protein
LLVEEFSPQTIVGVWSQEETKKLLLAIQIYGNNNWKKCSNFIQSRTSKQCRDKWFTCLQPGLNKAAFQEWEDHIILIQHKIIGNKWALIAQHLPGRNGTSVKNRWYSYLSKLHFKK